MGLTRVGLGEDGHLFCSDADQESGCYLGGILVKGAPPFKADSDGDVIIHAICHAITSLNHAPILSEWAPRLCHDQGITESRFYLEKGLTSLTASGLSIVHLALSLEGDRPRFDPVALKIRHNLSQLLCTPVESIGLSLTSGHALSACGRGEGVTCTALLTVETI